MRRVSLRTVHGIALEMALLLGGNVKGDKIGTNGLLRVRDVAASGVARRFYRAIGQ